MCVMGGKENSVVKATVKVLFLPKIWRMFLGNIKDFWLQNMS